MAIQVVTLEKSELEAMLRQAAEFGATIALEKVKAEPDEIGGIDLAVKITGKAKPTIYSLVSKRQIPHSKRGNALYFSKSELLKWLADGKRKTQEEIVG